MPTCHPRPSVRAGARAARFPQVHEAALDASSQRVNDSICDIPLSYAVERQRRSGTEKLDAVWAGKNRVGPYLVQQMPEQAGARDRPSLSELAKCSW